MDHEKSPLRAAAAWEAGGAYKGVPQLSAAQAARAACAHFSLPGEPAAVARSARMLPSERDLNVRLDDGAGRAWLLKLSNNYEAAEAVDMEVAAQDVCAQAGVEVPRAQHAAARRTSFTGAGASPRLLTDAPAAEPPPRVVRLSGYLARLVSFVPGSTLAHAFQEAQGRAAREALLESWGEAAGAVAGALAAAAFEHVGAERGPAFAWDLANARGVVARHAGLLRAKEQAACSWAMDMHADAMAAAAASGGLRRSVVHNDANEHNVIVRDGRAVALIDFGDCCHTETVNDCAIAAAYAMMVTCDAGGCGGEGEGEAGTKDVWPAACAVVRGYVSRHALTEAELDAIFPLAVMRVCVSLAMSTSNAAAAAQEAYDRAATTPSTTPQKRRERAQSSAGAPLDESLPVQTQLNFDAATSPGSADARPERAGSASSRFDLDGEPTSPRTQHAEYLLISQAPAREVLRRLYERRFAPQAAAVTLRAALGMAPCLSIRASELRLAIAALHAQACVTPLLAGVDLNAREVLDAAPARGDVGALAELLVSRGAEVAVASYGAHAAEGSGHTEIGMDLFVAQPDDGIHVQCPLNGEVVDVSQADRLGAGGAAVAIGHRALGIDFFCIIGGIVPAEGVVAGARVRAGDVLGRPAVSPPQPARVRLQLALSLFGGSADLPRSFALGEDETHRVAAMAAFPDPNCLLRVPALPSELADDGAGDRAALAEIRHAHMGRNLSLSGSSGGPQAPGALHMVRGKGQYLYTSDSERYLDMVNNVAHCGHCEDDIDKAVADQLRAFNSNSRYLHRGAIRYAERLASLFPPELECCYLVTSGSEANDLALRMARAATGGTDIVVLDGAYHGHTLALIEASPYKSDGPGGAPQAANVLKAAMPDPLRKPMTSGDEYATPVTHAMAMAERRHASGQGGGAAAFMCEPVLGCGGQLPLPRGYLRAAFAAARAGGALCVCDEVQTGFYRCGLGRDKPWAFQEHGVVPDIVTLGKPIGNGFPMGAVVCTRAVADAFANGMEFFATFGATPAAAAAGNATLDAIERLGVAANAEERGAQLLAGLTRLARDFPCIAEARGRGLFVGVELVRVRGEVGDAGGALVPAPARASWLAQRLRARFRVLVSTDGPHDSVLKLKPPMVISRADVAYLLSSLGMVLTEMATCEDEIEAAEDAREPRLQAGRTPPIGWEAPPPSVPATPIATPASGTSPRLRKQRLSAATETLTPAFQALSTVAVPAAAEFFYESPRAAAAAATAAVAAVALAATYALRLDYYSSLR